MLERLTLVKSRTASYRNEIINIDCDIEIIIKLTYPLLATMRRGNLRNLRGNYFFTNFLFF